MEVRSHEYIKVTRCHDGCRGARHGRRVRRNLQCRRRVKHHDQRGCDYAIHHPDDDHARDARNPTSRREDWDDPTRGSAPGEALVPGHGLRLEWEFRLQFGIGVQLGRERSGQSRRGEHPVVKTYRPAADGGPGRIAGKHSRDAERPQPIVLASRRSSPESVWLVAAVICTSVSSPGAARPLKLTALLWRVRPRRRSGSVREVPSTSTSTVRSTNLWARSRARRWTTSNRRSIRSTFTG